MELSRVLWRCGVLNLAGVGCGGHRVLLPITGDGSGRESGIIGMQNRKHFTPKCGRVRTFFLAPELQQREITLEEKTSGTIKIYTLNKGEFKNPLPSILATRAYTVFGSETSLYFLPVHFARRVGGFLLSGQPASI